MTSSDFRAKDSHLKNSFFSNTRKNKQWETRREERPTTITRTKSTAAYIDSIPPKDGRRNDPTTSEGNDRTKDYTTMASLTSTTAPGKIFASRAELADHYKSDWHRYNLKRREAVLPLLREDDFMARLEAALALRREREGREERSGTAHLKAPDKHNKKKEKKMEEKARRKNNAQGTNSAILVSQADAYEKMKNREESATVPEASDSTPMEDDNEEDEDMAEEPPTIDPCQDLFTSHTSSSIEENIAYMTDKYGFFIPDREYLVDTEGLVGYCSEKIRLGHICLYCHKVFRTYTGCLKHMVSKRHTKIKYDHPIDMAEFDPFYDFAEANAEFLGTTPELARQQKQNDNNMVVEEEDGDDDEWEDINEDEKMGEEDDDEMYDGYANLIAKHGFDVTPLGELVFPDGRIVGHRGLARYYKQKFAPENDKTAVVAARRAAGERLIEGNLYDTYRGDVAEDNGTTALQLAKSGLAMGAAKGRSGKGILVSAGGKNGFTAVSLYRYKAVMKKARVDDARGQRLQERTRLPMNKMDKKANRLHNNVSVAHAPR
eukprot:scaffold297622_cov56-Attheya_sp.AAC.5